MAPEIVMKRDYLGCPADMWSIGVIFYALCTGSLPFRGIYFE